MISKAVIMPYSNVLDPISMDSRTQTTTRLYSDEYCLEVMRSIVKEFIGYKQQNTSDPSAKQSFKNRYEEWRQMVRDETLRAFTSFELMEKLYWQEYLIRD